MQRINWIDRVKAWCITVVVFCHLPQQEDTFYLQYLASVILSSFFFVSGYLKKPSASLSTSLKKYGYSLLIPYIIYNAIYYPYWLAKYAIEHGDVSFTEILKPITGALLLQLNSDFSCELNGVTWFLPALFLMHLITDICNRQRHGSAWMLGISLVVMVLYGANKYYHFAPYLTFHGLIRSIPFFFMGNLLRNTHYLKGVCFKKDLLIGASMFTLSLLMFYWHIHEDTFILHILLYFIVNALSVFGIIHLFRMLNSIKISLVTCISYGTMVIFGLHRMLIGIIDYIIEKMLHLTDICYSIPQAVVLTMCIELALLPIIIYAKRHCPILLGHKFNKKY